MTKKILTNEELRDIQQMANENNILLPAELNANIDSKINEEEDEVLMPMGLI